MTIIDIHAHIIVPEILREAAPSEEWRPRVLWEGGQQFVEYNGRRIGSATREFVHIEGILDEMNKSRVEAALLCPWVSLVRYDAKPEESLVSCQVQNDALAALSKKHPKRIAALGLVPLQDVPRSVRELERLMQSGLRGVEIGTQIDGVYPGDHRFRPFWEACEALGALVFIHPVEGGGRPELKDYYMWNVIGNPLETAIAAGGLILSGLIEAYPHLVILLAHGGGALPALRGRLDHGFQVRPEIKQTISRPPSETLKQFYFDSITHDPLLLRELVDFAGADHILLGSDYPFDMGNENPVAVVQSSNLTIEAEKMILGGNAKGLLGGLLE